VRDGRIEQIGTPSEVYLHPATRFVADFFGENNLVAGQVVGDADGTTVVDTPIGRLHAQTRGWRPTSGEAAFLAFRPERMHIKGAEMLENAVAATLTDIRFLGPNHMLELRPEAASAEPIRVRELASASPPAIGQKIMLRWSKADTTLIPADAHG
jgi:ABC-type Fe3+/spermidine/putrescine transport system ATPase subunit